MSGAAAGLSRWLAGAAVTLLTFAASAAGAAGPPQAPSRLTTDLAVEPVGIGARPVFGWQVNDTDANEIQTKYRIRLASTADALAAGRADVWDSGDVTSRQQHHVEYGGPALQADRQYFWQVRTWDKDGAAGVWSPIARFVVGPLSNADWSGASWIRRASADADDYTYYRRTAELPNKSIRRATVYVTSVHKYELFVNGQRVGKGPAYHYPQFQYYNGFDVTKLVRPGGNLFAIFNHWFGGGQGRAVGARGVLMRAVVHYTDGTSVVVGTDGAWKQLRAPAWVLEQVSRNPGEGVGFVERIDARRLLPAWNQPSFDDASWAPVEVIGGQPTEPWVNPPRPDLTRIVEREIAPAAVRNLGGGTYLVDLGKVYSGMPRITFSGGTPGQVVRMLGGYALAPDGRVDTAKNQVTDLGFFAELSGATFVYAPTEYLGMRYLQIEKPPMPITAANVRFVVRHHALDASASSFESPNATLDAVWELMKHSLTVNAQEEYVDTPTREKGGFLGDAGVMSIVAMPALGERLLTRRTLGEFVDSMEQFWSSPENRGRMNAVYPNNDNGRDIPDYTQAYLVWVWAYYMETGDVHFLRSHYSHLRAVAEYVYRSRNEETGLITNLPGGGGDYLQGIIDWPPSMRYGYDMTTAARSVINFWAYADFDIVSKIAAAVGQSADRDLYRQRAEALATAINERLINADGVYVDGLMADGRQSMHVSQHANMFPLALGLVPEARLGTVTAAVKDMKMRVGMVTVLFLVRGLGEAGQGEHLIELLTNPSWDGWAAIMSRGATATWESWSADTENHSQSHAWGAAGLEAHVRYVLGIRPARPGYEEVQIKPLLFGRALTSARGSIPTDRGEIRVDWSQVQGRHGVTVTLPANTTASVYVPKGAASGALVRIDNQPVQGVVDGAYVRVTVGSGTHRIERTLQ